jgi:hypothetical protein
MNKGVAVQTFYRDGGRERISLRTKSVTGSQQKDRAQALAPTLHAVEHGGMEPGRAGPGWGEVLLDARFDLKPVLFHSVFVLHGVGTCNLAWIFLGRGYLKPASFDPGNPELTGWPSKPLILKPIHSHANLRICL